MLPGSSLDELRKGLSTTIKKKIADQTKTVNLRRIFVRDTPFWLHVMLLQANQNGFCD